MLNNRFLKVNFVSIKYKATYGVCSYKLFTKYYYYFITLDLIALKFK